MCQVRSCRYVILFATPLTTRRIERYVMDRVRAEKIKAAHHSHLIRVANLALLASLNAGN